MNNCPKCNSEFIDVDSSWELQTSYVYCTDCGFKIQESVPEEDIIEMWNSLEPEYEE